MTDNDIKSKSTEASITWFWEREKRKQREEEQLMSLKQCSDGTWPDALGTFWWYPCPLLPFQTPPHHPSWLTNRAQPCGRPLHWLSLELQQKVGSRPTAVARSKSWVWLTRHILTDRSSHSSPHKCAPQNGICFPPPAIGAIIASSGYQPLGKATEPFSNTLYQVPEINSPFKYRDGFWFPFWS